MNVRSVNRHRMAIFAEHFRNPSAAWRGKPFWCWNGELEKTELIRQIHVLKEMGMGGYFMHSRTGLATEYLGSEWFALINACAEEGDRLGMESWLYDEDRWPSGTAGGRVTVNPDYRMKFIHLAKFAGDTFDLASWRKGQTHPLGAWSCRLDNEVDIYEVAPVSDDTTSAELNGKTVLAFRIMPMADGPFYNGNTYVDTMKREATDEYIRLTHEAYKEHCGHHFGRTIKGIFTDEPHRGGFMSGFGFTGNEDADTTCLIPWTDALFEAFAEMHGIRAENHLPALFLREDGQPVSRIKAQYAETMLMLFLKNFAKPCYDWCEENNLQLTGHVLHENSLSAQVSTNGSLQRYYPYMHVPGIDFLCEHGREYWVAKQVDSVARQFQRPWIVSELYGCTGWQMNFESHKAIGAWQALFGVNVRCHHLAWYTMAGEAKRDYPASIFHQSPWYREYEAVETWFGRLGCFRAQGKPCCDLLVINPVESLWGRVYPGAIRGMNAADPEIKTLEQRYAELFHVLAGRQIDFDYGDEALLAEHGAVAAKDGRPALDLEAMSYSTVMVAGLSTLRRTTLDLLKTFAEAGGTVIFAGMPPAYVDNLPSTDAEALASFVTTCALEEDAIVRALKGHCPHRVCIVDASSGRPARDVFCQLRNDGGDFYLTVLNTNRDEMRNVVITLDGIPGNTVEEWDLETGEATRIALQPANHGDLAFLATLHTSQARCFRIVAHSDLPMAVAPPQPADEAAPMILDQPVRYSLAEANVCVLDLPAWALNDGEEQAVNDVLRIDRQVRQMLGVPIRTGDMVQPWFRGRHPYPILGKVMLRYPLRIRPGVLDAAGGVHLAMETPGRFTVEFNGVPIDTSQDNGWWCDIAFRRIVIPRGVLREGDNELVLTCDFSEDLNLEAMYLLGQFGVVLEGTTPCLTVLPETLLPGSIVQQDLPYYSGSIVYHHAVPPAFVGMHVRVRVPAYEGAYVKVSSNGLAKMIPWRPDEACLTLGEVLDVEVCVTRKNTFGPLHLVNPRPAAVHPGCFVPDAAQFSLEPVFLESGLLAPVELTRLA